MRCFGDHSLRRPVPFNCNSKHGSLEGLTYKDCWLVGCVKRPIDSYQLIVQSANKCKKQLCASG